MLSKFLIFPVLLVTTVSYQATSASETRPTTTPTGTGDNGHWAWKAVQRGSLPSVHSTSWAHDPVDQFILTQLIQADLSPAPPVDPSRWLRRIWFDLTGLPPSTNEMDRLLRDSTPTVHHQIVDQLLGSPRFGEHWAQHWLDLVRFAETHGQEQDWPIKNAYHYRDYVIRALNQDVPYDQFVVEHLAGDLVKPPRIDAVDRSNQSIQGTGFWLMGEANHIPIDLRGDEADRRENQIEVFSKAFLGLAVNCARCHDHKFDAISTEDYYALCGYLQSSSYQQANVADPAARQQALDQLITLRSKHAQRLLEIYAKAIEVSRLSDYLVVTLQGAPVAGVEPLNSERLEKFTVLLEEAQQDLGNPFYPLVRFALHNQQEGAGKSDPAQSIVQAVVQAWQTAVRKTSAAIGSQKTIVTREEGERNYVTSEQPWDLEDVLLDFANPQPKDWITSGLRFGRGPAQTGELLFGKEKSSPLKGIVIEDAAHSGLYSDHFTGILRTPTFEITSDTIWYRYRGNAKVFLVVDSYRCGAEPGSVHHGKHLFRTLEGDRDYRWESHQIARYLGHRVHVEFTPEEGFSLSRIQFSAATPIDPFEPNTRIASLLAHPEIHSLKSLANLYEGLFVQAAHDLAMHQIRPQNNIRDAARLVEWLIGHPDLVEIPDELARELARQWQSYQAEKAAIESQIPPPQEVLALLDANGEDEFIHVRGDHKNLSSEAVPRRLLAALGGLDQPRSNFGSGRLQLAQGLTDPTNPLIVRVIVNRVWQRLFGQGLVRTVDDLGVLGEAPSHPQLLDYLAAEFVDNGWSLKWLIRRLVLSRVYALSSHPQEDAEQADPANRLLHRMPLRRLSAESIRDTMLILSGRLNSTMEGPSVPAYYTSRNKSYQIEQPSGPADGDGRRCIYLEVRRNQPLELLTTFGRPVSLTTVGQRDQSPTTAQPLTLLNDPFVHQQAQLWAKRLLQESDVSRTERIRQAFWMAFSRYPEKWEILAGLAFLDQQLTQVPTVDQVQAWTNLCHTLFNVKEFLFY